MSRDIHIISSKDSSEVSELFGQVPREIYPADSPYWKHKSRINEEFLSESLIAMVGDKALGRLALYNNPDLHFENKKAFCIGNYECKNDLEVSSALISYAKGKAKSYGAKYLIGPMNGSTWDDYRFSLNNEHPNFFLEPWHHIYYNEQFKEAGFAEISRYISLLDEEMNFEDKLAEKREKEMQAEGIIFRPADMNNFEGELVAIHDFCLEAFKDNFLFTPITQESFLSKYLKIEKIINPEYFIIAEDKNKNILGFIFAIDDLFNTDKKTLIIKTVARHPSRKYYGMGNILGKKIYDIAKKNKYDSVLHAFMIDDGLSKNISRKFSGKAYKQYALYGMAI